MSWIAAATIGSTVVGGYMQGQAAKSAASSQSQAARTGMTQGMAINDQVYADQQALFNPYQQSGLNAQNALSYEMGMGAKPQGYSGFQFSPFYASQLEQGQRGIDGAAAARGSVFSGANQKAQMAYSQGLAGQEYNNWMNRLTGMAGQGQGAAGMAATAAGNYGAAQGNALTAGYGGIGNAQAAGAIGVGNAVNSGINNALGAYGYQQMLQTPYYQTPQ